VLIKVKAASICHSDLMLWESNEAGLAINDAKPFTMVSTPLLHHQ
jgi:propanol-preferring alcohol dehydrogenase